MILLKKPYTPVVFTSASKVFNVYGKSFTRLEAVYLSGAPYNDQTFYNPFSAYPKLSAHYPGFYGVKLLSSEYSTNFDNTITITVPSATNTGYIDIIAQNPAGYGTLTQYVIKDLRIKNTDLSAIRPWSKGINVISFIPYYNQMYTISDDILVTINNENIVAIEYSPPLSSSFLITNNEDYIITDTNHKIVFGV